MTLTIQKLQKWCCFWIHKLQKYCSLWIQKSWKWTKIFLDPDIVEMLRFLDPETAVFLQFLDPEIVEMDQKISGSRNRRNGVISGSRNRRNGRQILYDSGHPIPLPYLNSHPFKYAQNIVSNSSFLNTNSMLWSNISSNSRMYMTYFLIYGLWPKS